MAHLRLGHHQRGVEILLQDSRLAPDEPKILLNLARVEERLGQLEKAVFHYRAALRLRPDDPDAAKAVDRLTSQTTRSLAGH